MHQAKFVAEDILKLVLFFIENKSWLLMWIVCQAEDSHEKSRLIFCEK